jgi:hypothetical protein
VATTAKTQKEFRIRLVINSRRTREIVRRGGSRGRGRGDKNKNQKGEYILGLGYISFYTLFIF